MKLPTFIIEPIARRVIAHALKTPYYHLKHPDGSPYMDRFWVVPYSYVGSHGEGKNDGTGPVVFRSRPFTWVAQKIGLAARVHNIRSSDDDRAPHDHPWPYLTIVLLGGYWELIPVYSKETGVYLGMSRNWRGPGSTIYRKATSMHILELPEGRDAWTLFMTGKYVQKWGFMVDLKNKIKMPYDQFFRERGQKQ